MTENPEDIINAYKTMQTAFAIGFGTIAASVILTFGFYMSGIYNLGKKEAEKKEINQEDLDKRSLEEKLNEKK
jgi:hypothetical protein